MDPVHAVLRNTDILPIILEFMITDDFRNRVSKQFKHLVAAALVCHLFSDAALDVLWRHIEWEEIYFLFPMDIVHVWPRGDKSLTHAPDTPSHWERFDAHAYRIHELSSYTRDRDAIFLGAIQARFSPPHYPFPNLTRLSWDCNPSQLTALLGLICPTLTQVALSIDGWDGDHEDDTVAEFLWALGDICPSLRKMEYRHWSISERRSKRLEHSLIYLIRQSARLQEACLPVSRNILQALGHLPHLSNLRLDHATWEDESLTYPDTPEEPRTEEEDMFVALDDLTVQGPHTFLSLTECFQGSGCFPREGFSMEMTESGQWSTPAIAQFFRGILRSDRSAGLKTICIDWGEDPLSVEDTPWQPLRCLPSMPHLQLLYLDGLTFDINDSDLKELPRIWPDLDNIQLNVPREIDYQSQITFEGLVHLSTLQNLESASLMLNPESTITESMLSVPICFNSPLKTLIIEGKFPNVTIYAAVKFFIFNFPRLERIGPQGWRRQEGQQWGEVETLLKVVRRQLWDRLEEPLRSFWMRGFSL